MIKTVLRYNKDFKLGATNLKAIEEFNDLDDIGMSDDFIQEHNLGITPYLQRSYSNDKDHLPLSLIKDTMNSLSNILIFSDKKTLVGDLSLKHSQLKELNDILASHNMGLGLLKNINEVKTEIILIDKEYNEAFNINEFETFVDFEKRLKILTGNYDEIKFKKLSHDIRNNDKMLYNEILKCGIDRINENERFSLFRLNGGVRYNRDFGPIQSGSNEARIFIFDKVNPQNKFIELAESPHGDIDLRIEKRGKEKPVLSTSQYTKFNDSSEYYKNLLELCDFGPRKNVIIDYIYQ